MGLLHCMIFLFLAFLRNLHTVLYNSHINLHSHQQCRHFSKDRWLINTLKDAQHHSLLEMQIKTTMKYHFTLVRMAIIKKKSTNNKCWRGCEEKRNLLHCWWACKLIQLLWRRVWRFLKKLEVKLPYDPAIPFLAYTLRKSLFQKTHVLQYSLQQYLH